MILIIKELKFSKYFLKNKLLLDIIKIKIFLKKSYSEDIY